MMMTVTLLALGCGKSDDEVDSGGKSKNSLPSNMIGTWTGKEMNGTNYVVSMSLRADGTSDYLLTRVSGYSINTITQLNGAKWTFKSSENKILIYTSSDKAYHFTVSSFTGSSMIASVKNTSGGVWNFLLERYTAGSGGSSGGYGGGGYDDGGGSGGSGGGGSTGYVCAPCGGSGRCSHCHASGKCPTCVGDGWYYSSYGSGKLSCPNCYTPGNDYRYGDGKCSFCAGTGKCRSCNGTGYK